MEKSFGPGAGITFDHYWGLLLISGNRKNGLYLARCRTGNFDSSCLSNTYKNDSGVMEKKITPKFFLISSFNIIPIIIMTGGHVMDSLALVGVLIVLMLNHITLLKIVTGISASMTEEGANAKRALTKTLFLLFFKMVLLIAIVAAIYFYKQELTAKVLFLMIFQLIIQVVSIKNNY